MLNNRVLITYKYKGTKLYFKKDSTGLGVFRSPGDPLDHIDLVKDDLYVGAYQMLHKKKKSILHDWTYEMHFDYGTQEYMLSSLKSPDGNHVIDPIIMKVRAAEIGMVPNVMINEGGMSEECSMELLTSPSTYFEELPRHISGVLIIGDYQFRIDNPHFEGDKNKKMDDYFWEMMSGVVGSLNESDMGLVFHDDPQVNYMNLLGDLLLPVHLPEIPKYTMNSFSQHLLSYDPSSSSMLCDHLKSRLDDDDFRLYYRVLLSMIRGRKPWIIKKMDMGVYDRLSQINNSILLAANTPSW